MKKIFISLLAAASLTCAYAIEPLQVESFTAQSTEKVQLSGSSDLKNNMIQAAANETIDINGVLAAEQIEGYYGLDWWVVIKATDYTVNLDIYSTTLAGTYSLSDVDPDFSNITDKSGNEITFSTLSFTITGDATTGISLTGTATDSKGTTYNITGTKLPIPTPKDTITLVFDDEAQLVKENGAFYLSKTGLFPSVSKDSIHAAVGFNYSGKDINGTYTYKDRASYANYILYCGKDTVKVEPMEILNATVVTKSGLYAFRVDMLGNDTSFYQLTLYADAPDPIVPKKTIDFWATNLSVENYTEYLGLAIFEASNDDYHAIIGINTDSIYGTFTDDAISSYTTIYTKTDTLSVLSGTLQFENWYGTDMLFGTVITSDTVQYNIMFDWEAPAAKDTTKITFANIGIGEYVKKDQYVTLYNKDSQYLFMLTISTDSVGGTFTKDNLYYDQTAIGIVKTDTTVVSVLTADVKVTDLGNQMCTVEANILGSDTIYYQIRSSYVWTVNNGMNYDSQTGSVDRTYTSSDVINYTADGDTAIIFSATSSSDAVYLEFYVAKGSTTIPAGTYEINGSKNTNTVYACDGVQNGYLYPSFYATLNEKGNIINPMYFLESGTVVVEYVNDDTKITVNAFNSYNVPIHIVYDSSMTALDNTTDTSAKATKVVRDGKMYIITTDHIYDATGTLLK